MRVEERAPGSPAEPIAVRLVAEDATRRRYTVEDNGQAVPIRGTLRSALAWVRRTLPGRSIELHSRQPEHGGTRLIMRY